MSTNTNPSIPTQQYALRTAVALAAAGLLLMTGVVDAVAEYAGTPLKTNSEQRLTRTLTRATVAYLSAAAVNSTISVLKTSQMEASFFVVGGSVTVGEVLDPIHDLVEQLSSVLTLCVVSLGLQRLLLSIAVDVALKYVLGPGFLLLAVAALWRSTASAMLRRIGRALVVVGLLGRLGLPTVFVVSDEFSERTTAVRIEGAQRKLEAAQSELSTIVFGSSDSPSTRVKKAREIGERALTAIVDLMVAFLFRVVLLPILLLYLVSQIAALLIRTAPVIVGTPPSA